MTDDLVGRPLWDAFCDLCNTHGPRGYGRDSKERIAFGADLNAFWQLVEADHQAATARIEALEGALRRLIATYDGMETGDGEPCPDIAAARAALTPEAPHAD